MTEKMRLRLGVSGRPSGLKTCDAGAGGTGKGQKEEGPQWTQVDRG